MRRFALLSLFVSSLFAWGCRTAAGSTPQSPLIRAASLAPRDDALAFGASRRDFEALRRAFATANPGYDLAWWPGSTRLEPSDAPRVVFVQGGQAACRLAAAGSDALRASEVALGDLILVRPGEALTATAPLDLLAFRSPEPFPTALPSFVRPDHDPKITDTPGGCAEEDEAYRRILVTWSAEVGPYTYHAVNAHRVRIQDSFTHYHPADGGFDELYLVQEARPGALLVTSEQTARIERPEEVDLQAARSLLTTRPLAVGDLIYLPRGTVHRGLGGAVVQVITVPGFVPEREVGVDHALRQIAERHGLGQDALPYRAASANGLVVK